jgi:MSHA biogenesis protein MshI
LNWFRKSRRRAGWMVLDTRRNEFLAVHGEHTSTGKPHIHQFTVQASDSPSAGLERGKREFGLHQYQCATLLRADEYQIVVVERPNVPREELKTAIRWRIKDLLDQHVDDVTLDVLEIPVPDDANSRNPMMYAIAARNEVIQERVSQFEAAGIPLAVIDIEETAQRNITALFEEPDRAVATLYMDEQGGLLTVNYRGELFLARRFEASLNEIAAPGGPMGEAAHERIVLELQRSLDHFERQFRSIPVGRLLLAPEATESGLLDTLAKGLGIKVQCIDLNEVINLSGGPMASNLQWRLFHSLGASLRHEARAL